MSNGTYEMMNKMMYSFTPLQDVCPYVFNPEQNSLVCEPIGKVILLIM